MRKKAALYPFYPDTLPWVKRFNEMQNEYELTCVMSPASVAVIGKDAAYAQNLNDIGMNVSEYDLEVLKGYETVIACKPKNEKINIDGHLTEVIESLTQSNVDVILLANENDSLAMTHANRLKYRQNKQLSEIVKGMEAKHKKKTVPLLMAGGVITEAGTEDVIISLANQMSSRGVRAAVVSCNPYGGPFGYFNPSSILYSTTITEPEKIMKLNVYLRAIEILTRPDVIIAEAPGAVMPYNDLTPNGYGIYAYIMCQAFQPDSFVLCTTYDMAKNALLEMFAEYTVSRFNAPIAAVHVSNAVVDGAELENKKVLTAGYINLRLVETFLEHHGKDSVIPITNVNTDDGLGLSSIILNR